MLPNRFYTSSSLNYTVKGIYVYVL